MSWILVGRDTFTAKPVGHISSYHDGHIVYSLWRLKIIHFARSGTTVYAKL
jgi:hypothetical protein